MTLLYYDIPVLGVPIIISTVFNSEFEISNKNVNKFCKTQKFYLQTKEMLSKWNWIAFNFIIYVTTASHKETLPEDEAKAFFELTELDYEDTCYNIANVQWSFIVSPSNETLSIWVNTYVFKCLI